MDHLVVEGLPTPVWVTAPDQTLNPAEHIVYEAMADLVAHWVWRCTPSLTPLVENLSRTENAIAIQLELGDCVLWFDDQEDENAEQVLSWQIENNVQLVVRATPALVRQVNRSDNRGERMVMAAVIAGIAQLAYPERSEVDRAQLIESIVDRHIPLGMAKKLLVFNVGRDPRLEPTGLARRRRVQPSEVSELLDQLGHHLQTDLNLAKGPAPSERRGGVLNAAVDYYYRRLVHEVSCLSPSGLLEWLVGMHEALVQKAAEHQLRNPARLACFQDIEDVVQQTKEETLAHSESAVASRFLIEYVTACPPIGIRPISLSAYDRLLALASEICAWGRLSDLHRYDLADVGLEMLGSGRLGTDRRVLQAAQEGFLAVHIPGEIEGQQATFDRYWATSRGASRDRGQSVLDSACEAEFGLTLTDLTTFLSELASIASDTRKPAQVLQRAILTERIGASLGWTNDKCEAALTLFSLAPRDEFLKPLAPFSSADVYPWKFNRALSYLRRPLLIRPALDQADDEVVWGNRHLWDAVFYLHMLCRGGRIKAQSQPMKRFVTSTLQRESNAFNDLVADLYQALDGFVVRRQVDKIGHLRIHGPNGPLGDIDVLAADTRRCHILAIETKDLAVARTPAELANEIESMFKGDYDHRPFVEKHLARTAWIREHLAQVLEWLGLTSRCRGWRVTPLIVLDQELLSPFLVQSPIEVISLRRLRDRLPK
jgi:hypothetical protein